MTEVWRQHPRYALTVSSLGRVQGPKRLRRVRFDRGGYERLNIQVDGKIVTVHVHKLVAECFIGPLDGMTVNHKDGRKTNNCADNLELLSSADNVTHAFRSGLVGTCKPTAGFYSQHEASRQLGISRKRLRDAPR